jgi:hypothetical protein
MRTWTDPVFDDDGFFVTEQIYDADYVTDEIKQSILIGIFRLAGQEYEDSGRVCDNLSDKPIGKCEFGHKPLCKSRLTKARALASMYLPTAVSFYETISETT